MASIPNESVRLGTRPENGDSKRAVEEPKTVTTLVGDVEVDDTQLDALDTVAELTRQLAATLRQKGLASRDRVCVQLEEAKNKLTEAEKRNVELERQLADQVKLNEKLAHDLKRCSEYIYAQRADNLELEKTTSRLEERLAQQNRRRALLTIYDSRDDYTHGVYDYYVDRHGMVRWGRGKCRYLE